ncbi:hypothetical protein ACQPZK_25400 [Micromonospora sp. CA-249363]|uniref:hypothetical protein n=1 Tax=Micromonospora sp. CA-249363 TaxID=3239963 RepID=UPI003D93235B
MSRETDIRDRMVQVAQNLLQQTLEGRARWSTTDQEDAYLFSGSRSSVKIEFYEDHDEGSVCKMSLLNQRGTLVQALKTELIPPTGTGPYEPADWNEVLERLYDAARREALDIDDLLDSVLDDLSKDPPPKSKKNDDWPQPAKPTRAGKRVEEPDPWGPVLDDIEAKRRRASNFDEEPPF